MNFQTFSAIITNIVYILLKIAFFFKVNVTESRMQLRMKGEKIRYVGKIVFPPLSNGKIQPSTLASCIDDSSK